MKSGKGKNVSCDLTVSTHILMYQKDEFHDTLEKKLFCKAYEWALVKIEKSLVTVSRQNTFCPLLTVSIWSPFR